MTESETLLAILLELKGLKRELVKIRRQGEHRESHIIGFEARVRTDADYDEDDVPAEMKRAPKFGTK